MIASEFNETCVKDFSNAFKESGIALISSSVHKTIGSDLFYLLPSKSMAESFFMKMKDDLKEKIGQ